MMQSRAAIPATNIASTSGAEDLSTWRWHLLFTKPLGELIAAGNLERQGYRVYYPRVRQRVLQHRVWREAISSLFPRYLFVQLNASVQSLAPIRSTLGVCSVRRFGVEYAVVPDGVVADLKHRGDPQSGLRSSVFNRGNTVRIIGGPLAGLDGIFGSHEAQDRIVNLLNLLGAREPDHKVAASSIVPS
jgi:transcriptional antiterminator RfaH